ncbi:multidrug efflux system outer membrane protein [Tibeticola sediminis]|uniref:Multidrug efflux system outer membrane protein n=1 Tax=Tibeticola sediminis TaxID=1917811 RepID=A0A3N4UQF9_9BURK|nr:efflux transporter outer membrane subunit [Tibeticola sediminis]RPE72882.1 multidrug efflux system outer membrane protein [Tibeticola sediminis]
MKLRCAPAAYPLLALALTLTLGACAPTTPYTRPPAPVAASWAAGAAPEAQTAEGNRPHVPTLEVGRPYAHEPALQHLITRALAHNRDLRVAALNVEQVRAAYGLRRADRLPTINLAATGQRQPSSNGSGAINSVYTAGLALASWELDFFGRVAALSDAAYAQYQASVEAQRAAQLSLVAAVTSSWLALQTDDALLAVARETLGARLSTLELVRLRFEHGAASEIDWRSAQTLVEAARVNLAQQERALALDRHALELLIGEPLGDAPLGLSERSDAGDAALPLPAHLSSDLLLRRPDILAAEQQLRAAHANLDAARAAFFPRITLTASAGTVSNALANLFQAGSWGWSLAPQALLPIFDAGRNEANLEAAEAARGVALAQYEKAIQTAFREVADALTARQTLADQLRAAEAQLQAQTALARLVQARFQAGVASQLEALDAQRALLAAQQQLEQTRGAWRQSHVALYKALGGEAVLGTRAP